MKSIATFPLAALCGLVMVGSLFLSWVKNIPEGLLALFGLGSASVAVTDGEAEIDPAAAFGGGQTSFGPSDMLNIPGFAVDQLFQDPMGIAVAASFVLAAAVAILGFLGGMVPRIFAVLAGVLPFGILGWGYFQMQDQLPPGIALPSLEDLGGFNGVMEQAQGLTPYIGLGLYAYFGGALLLLLLGLFSPSKKDAYDPY